MLTVEQAWQQIAETVARTQACPVPLVQAVGTVLAEDVVSTTDSPPFDKSMMDGYAVRVEDLQSDSTTLKVIEDVFAGQTAQQAVRPGGAIRIMTGAPVPAGATAVIPVEWTTLHSETDSVEIQPPRPVGQGANILPRGQSMRAGEVILRSGTLIRAQEIALLAETGHASPVVRRPPTIGILATGDELVEIDQTPGPGQIRNSNAIMLMAQVIHLGATPQLIGIARDDRGDLRTKIASGLKCDFLCLSGGVSAGEADLVPSELKQAGVREVFHKVAMKPGKPVWFGKRDGGGETGPCYVFGLPGNPVSSMVCFELFVRTAVREFLGLTPAGPRLCRARLKSAFEHRSDRQTWFPAQVTISEAGVWVQPAPWKGSADLRSTVEANCSLLIPPGTQTWSQGTEVDVLPWGTDLVGG
ncbi:molybdopterin molybdotransferase MoeA [Planctomicrobium sp. SH661]|uniref:molybdopterin molybdotransferase MoeA n=1 Tax=Planctomicrobium sp. SH661 TaxID=3448124 RepID=UPI003F5C6BEC